MNASIVVRRSRIFQFHDGVVCAALGCVHLSEKRVHAGKALGRAVQSCLKVGQTAVILMLKHQNREH